MIMITIMITPFRICDYDYDYWTISNQLQSMITIDYNQSIQLITINNYNQQRAI